MFLTLMLKAFIEGLLTPLGAVCVLPLYPGFLVYLSNRAKNASPLVLSFLVTLGVITFMGLLGLIFTTLLEVSLTKVIGIISPIAFAILGIISLMLIFNVDMSKFFPKINAPQAKNPLVESFFFGFFFGLIIIPCNPVFIALFFTQVISTTGFLLNMLQFLAFAIGISFPLMLLAGISSTKSKIIISFLTKHNRKINLVSGLIMLAISLYYLIFVFKVFGG